MSYFSGFYGDIGGLVGGIIWVLYIFCCEDILLFIISMLSFVFVLLWCVIIEFVVFLLFKKNFMEFLDEVVKVFLMELFLVVMVVKVMLCLMFFWLLWVESLLWCGWRCCDWEEFRYLWRGGRGWSEV